MRRTTIHRIQRVLLLIGFLAIVAVGTLGARMAGMQAPPVDTPGTDAAPQPLAHAESTYSVALISGHAGSDSGAVCTDAAGAVLVTEAEINARVAEQAAARLQLAGAHVEIMEEFDSRLEGLHADVLLSLHADSCIDASGYKAARHAASTIGDVESHLLGCIDSRYPAATGLAPHPNTVTHDMTLYHAFRRIAPTTPAAILEMGFLGGDQTLLTAGSARVAQGVADSLLCFLDGQNP